MKTTEARETQDNSNGSHQLPDRRTNEPKWNDAATVVSSRAQQTRLRQRADAASAVSLARSRAPDSARLPPAQGPAPSLAESAASGDAAEPVGRGGAGLPASASCCSSCSSRGGADSDSASRWLPLYRDKDWDWPAALAPHLARYEALVPAPPSRVGKTSRSGGVIGRRVMERVFLCRTASGREARFMLAAMPEMSLLTLMLTIRRHIVRYHKKLRETSPGTSGDSDADANADGDSDNGDGDDEDEEDGENGGEPFDSYSTSSESDEINDTMDVGADEGHVVGASMLLASFARRARNCPALWLDLEHPIREGLQAAAMHMLNWMGKESVVHQNYVAGHLAKFLVFTVCIDRNWNLLCLNHLIETSDPLIFHFIPHIFSKFATNESAITLLKQPIKELLFTSLKGLCEGTFSSISCNALSCALQKIFKYQNTVPQPSNLLTLMEESILLRIPDVRKFIERSTPLLGITLIQNSAVHDADIISSSCASLTSSRQAHARQEKWGIIAKQERFGSISAELSSVLIPALMKHTTTCTIYKCLTVGCICTLLKRTNPTTYTSSQRNEIYECVVSSLQAGSQSVTLPAAVCVLANTILIPTPEQETLLVDVILKTINDGKRVVHIDAQHFTKLFSLLKIPENIKKVITSCCESQSPHTVTALEILSSLSGSHLSLVGFQLLRAFLTCSIKAVSNTKTAKAAANILILLQEDQRPPFLELIRTKITSTPTIRLLSALVKKANQLQSSISGFKPLSWIDDLCSLFSQAFTRTLSSQCSSAASSALIESIKAGSLPLVQKFLTHPNTEHLRHSIVCSYKSSSQMTSLLLQRGAEPSADTLITAVRYSPDQTEMLLKAGADPNTPEPRTPLRYSIKSTNVHVVKLLLDYGAVPHSDHLYLAIRRKSIDIADILWRWGAQLTSRQHLDSLGKWAQLPAIAKFSAECYWTPASHRDCAPWLRKVVIQVLLCWKFSAIQTSSPCSYTIGHLHKDLLIGILCLLSPSSTRPHKL